MKTFFIIAITVALSMLYSNYFKEKKQADEGVEFFVEYPSTTGLHGGDSFSCKSLMAADIIGDNSGTLKDKKGIHGSISAGTDSVAMKVKDEDTLLFITGTAVEVGTAEGDEFSIIQNNNDFLMAVANHGQAISTVVINKDNGLAVWTKGNPDFFGYGAPFGLITYMKCN